MEERSGGTRSPPQPEGVRSPGVPLLLFTERRFPESMGRNSTRGGNDAGCGGRSDVVEEGLGGRSKLLPFHGNENEGALNLVGTVGFFTAVWLSKMAPPRVRGVMESAVSLLAGIPSVVYGLVGMLVLVPGIRIFFNVPDGASLLAAILVLAVMILPSIIKVSMTALQAVPQEYEDASLALGATPIETYFRVSVPAAKSCIAASVVLGVGRAIGEAMAVMMVSGNVANMPSLFESVRFLTSAVASEMSYSSGLQREALFSIALVLFFFILLITASLNFFLKRGKEA